MNFLRLAQVFSIGLKSGEYAGKNITLQPASSANFFKTFLRCQDALSMMITEPAGISTSNTLLNHNSNSLLFMLHIYSHLPMMSLPHFAATMLSLVNFLPCIFPKTLTPLGAYPYSRYKYSFIPLSSI